MIASLSPELQERVDAARHALATRPAVVAARLFGSAARGVTEPGDLDIAVMFVPDVDGFEAAVALQVDLERRLDFPVDVHDFDALPSDLQFRVLDEGIVLVDNDHRTRIRREVTAQLMYYDFKPYLDRIRQAALQRLATRTARG